MSWRVALQELLQREARPAHKFGHQPRLYELTREIVARMFEPPAYDDDAVFAAAYLHDLGVFVGHRPEDVEQLKTWDHVAYACERAPALLADVGFPAAKLPLVLACIREHQPKDAPQSFEATLLRDADILEQLGAIAVMRTAAKLGSDTRFARFADVRESLRRSLATLPAQLKLDGARELAAPRIRALQGFLNALDAESGQHLG